MSSKETIIYNGVDLKEFAPKVYDQKNLCKCEVICVEGTISGMPAVKILRSVEGYNVSVYGRVSQEVMSEIERSPIPDVKFFGPIERNMVSSLYSYGSIFLNLETNPACPNSVIEALASGVPVVGFDSGSLRELVGDAGIVLPYGEGNPWRLDSPDCEQLGWAIRSIFLRYDEYSQKARSRAEKMYSMDSNAELYLDVLTAKPITGRDCD